jgi:hypothetical protein
LNKKREKEGKEKGKERGAGWGAMGSPEKKIRSSLIFWGKSFGTWEKIQAMGS